MTSDMKENSQFSYITKGGITIDREHRPTSYSEAIESYVSRLDMCRGVLLSSNYEYPGRYTRWDTAIINPPLGIESIGLVLKLKAYNKRGAQLLPMLTPYFEGHEHIISIEKDTHNVTFTLKESDVVTTEEQRSRKSNIFSLLRVFVDILYSDEDDSLALYGAFGYDLAFQFDTIKHHIARQDTQRDLVLFLPDEVLVVDHHSARAWHQLYDFTQGKFSTKNIPREGEEFPFSPPTAEPIARDLQKGEYARLVETAKEKFRKGDLFEVVLTQVFREPCTDPPSVISRRLRALNPSPYSFLINLGEGEYLVGASPEMFVRVQGRRVETCPISGTIKRGSDPIEDSEQILKLLNSKKDESELTMCSDVDRNDKSRVCEAGSVNVIGRRQIEMYSRLIHTVDHIEGRLRQDMDAFDAFLSHAWAVTVTGAPKLWAMRFIESQEKSPRDWYGGAVGMVNFNGNMNTGLTLRTVRIKDGIAEVRAGATLLYDSNPAEEEAETELKASAMLDAVRGLGTDNHSLSNLSPKCGKGLHIVLIDHEDSFVHTLANYFRQTGADVTTLRTPITEQTLLHYSPNLVVLSPGPGCPQDFDCAKTISLVRKHKLPLFGVCMGHQAIAEAYGGSLAYLETPFHGKPSRLHLQGDSQIFAGLKGSITVGRYHSIYIESATLPKDFVATAKSDDGIIMAIEHSHEKVAGVQFHPESIMSLGRNAGQRIIENVVSRLATKSVAKS